MLRPEADALFIRDGSGNQLRLVIPDAAVTETEGVVELCEEVVMRLFLIKVNEWWNVWGRDSREQDCAFRETVSAQALQQRFCHHPQRPVELNVGIDAVNGPVWIRFPLALRPEIPPFSIFSSMV